MQEVSMFQFLYGDGFDGFGDTDEVRIVFTINLKPLSTATDDVPATTAPAVKAEAIEYAKKLTTLGANLIEVVRG